MKKLISKYLRRPMPWTLLTAVSMGVLYFLGGFIRDALGSYANLIFENDSEYLFNFVIYIIVGALIGVFLGLPFVLTAQNVLFAVFSRRNDLVRKAGIKTEISTLIIGTIYTALVEWLRNATRLIILKEGFEASEQNIPVASQSLPAVLTLAALGIAGYLILRCRRKSGFPPIVSVLAMAGVYIGAALAALWSVQVIVSDFLLSLLPINFIIICIKLICETVSDGRVYEEILEADGEPCGILTKPANWLWFALPAAILLLVVTISVLTLFGQKPDSIIQAWTQTTGWTFSQLEQ